jgi:hypothetical protein
VKNQDQFDVYDASIFAGIEQLFAPKRGPHMICDFQEFRLEDPEEALPTRRPATMSLDPLEDLTDVVELTADVDIDPEVVELYRAVRVRGSLPTRRDSGQIQAIDRIIHARSIETLTPPPEEVATG